MWKQSKKRMFDEQLLDSIVETKREWKRIEAIVEASIDPGERIIYQKKLTKAKFLFLLRQARERRVSAIRFP